jgi:hypothetical protein
MQLTGYKKTERVLKKEQKHISSAVKKERLSEPFFPKKTWPISKTRVTTKNPE